MRSDLRNSIAAVYCRLSKEDMDKDSEKTLSESIKNQKAFLESYALEHQWTIYDFYIDEDFSGSDRNRPEFNRLITDSLLGRFDTVLCKKQARFARDIEYVEKYIHGLFAERQIRFVAVLDNIDTKSAGRSVRKASQINSLVDEWYLADLSDNIIASLTTKRRNAEFIGSWAPYGYRKDPNNKNSLVIDPVAAEIVRMIFRRYENGYGISRIARELNALQVPNPLLYKQLQGEKINPNPEKQSRERHLWSPSTVSSILHNQTYTGYLVQGKYKKAGYKSKKLLRNPKSDWIIVPHCHEPVIDEATWNNVQKNLGSKCGFSSEGARRNLLAGRIFCGECGSKLVSSGGRSGSRKTSYLCCSRHNLMHEACPGARIEVSRLENILLDRINSFTNEYFDENYLLGRIDLGRMQSESDSERLKSRLQSLQDRSAALVNKNRVLYHDRLNDLISPEQYLEFKNLMENEMESNRSLTTALEAEIASLETKKTSPYSISDTLSQYLNFSSLNQSMVNQLIDSVYVWRRKKGVPQQITINWNF